MKQIPLLLAVLCSLTALRAESTSAPEPPEKPAAASAQEFQVAFGKVTIGDKEVSTAIEWNTRTGEARMLNAASFSDKETGQQGNLIGWVPVVDLQQAVQNLASQIQKQQTSPSKQTNAPATPGKAP